MSPASLGKRWGWGFKGREDRCVRQARRGDTRSQRGAIKRDLVELRGGERKGERLVTRLQALQEFLVTHQAFDPVLLDHQCPISQVTGLGKVVGRGNEQGTPDHREARQHKGPAGINDSRNKIRTGSRAGRGNRSVDRLGGY